jgi:hypothetical protein
LANEKHGVAVRSYLLHATLPGELGSDVPFKNPQSKLYKNSGPKPFCAAKNEYVLSFSSSNFNFQGSHAEH